MVFLTIDVLFSFFRIIYGKYIIKNIKDIYLHKTTGIFDILCYNEYFCKVIYNYHFLF